MTTPENGPEPTPESPRQNELDPTTPATNAPTDNSAVVVPRTRAEARALAAAAAERAATEQAASDAKQTEATAQAEREAQAAAERETHAEREAQAEQEAQAARETPALRIVEPAEPLPTEMQAARDELDVSASYHPEDFYGASSSQALNMTRPVPVLAANTPLVTFDAPAADPTLTEPAEEFEDYEELPTSQYRRRRTPTAPTTAAPPATETEPAEKVPVLVDEAEHKPAYVEEHGTAELWVTSKPKKTSWEDPDAFIPEVADDHDAAAAKRRQILQWAVPAGLVVVAGALRFIGLDHPHELVFDETYYVKDAYALSQFGYEANWGENANASFVAGEPAPQDTGSFVVHPPLGKWIIASGFALFGADNGWGWRSMTALAGVITVLLTYFLAKKLTRSIVWAGLAGLFVAIDGVAIVMSRVALLDGILAMFLVLGVLFITYDRAYLRFITYDPESSSRLRDLGYVTWNRPWVIAAGLAFGAATAVKWSGLYALAGFGIYLVVTDVFARYRSGAPKWWQGSLLQGAISFVYLVPIAVVAYVSSWTGWFITQGGFNRGHDGGVIAAFLDYHRQILKFHSGLSAPHPYASPAWQWPLLLRPTSMYWEADGDSVQAITAIPNPLLWWAGIAAVFYLLYRFAYKPTWTIPIVLTAIGVTYLPWLALPARTIFQFYTVVMVPFLAIALVLAMRQLAGTAKEPTPRQRAWRISIGIFVGLVVLVSAFFLPLWTAMPVPRWFWQIHMWMPQIAGVIPGWV